MPQVGDAWIEVHADGSSLYREVRDAAERAAAGAKIKLKVELDTKGLAAKVKAAGERASKSAKVTFKTDLDTKGLAAKVRAAAKVASGAKVKVQAELDKTTVPRLQFLSDFEAVETGARRAALTARRALLENKVQIPTEFEAPSVGEVITKTQFLQGIFKAHPVEIPVKLDMKTGLQTALLQSRNALRGFGSDVAGLFGGKNSLLKPLINFGEAVKTVFKFTIAQGALLVTAVSVALPYVEALGVALAGLAVDIGSAALASAGFLAGGVVAIGAAAAATAVGVKGLGDAYKAIGKVQELQAQKGKRTKAEQETLNKALEAQKTAMDGLSTSARHFVQATVRLQGPWQTFVQSVQARLFAGLGTELERTARVVLPTLAQGLGGVAGVVNDLTTNFLVWARSADGLKTMNAVFAQSETVLRQLGDAAGNVGQGLLTLLVGGKDNTFALGNAFVSLTQDFQNWAAKVTTVGAEGTSPLQRFYTDARVNLGKISDLLGSTGGLISAFWQNWVGAAGNRPDILGDLQGQIERWASALRDPANAGAIRDFVTQAAADFNTLKEAVVDVATVIQNMSQLKDVLAELGGFGLAPASGQKSLEDQVRSTIGEPNAIVRFIKKHFGDGDEVTVEPTVTVTPKVEVKEPPIGDIQALTRSQALKRMMEGVNVTAPITVGFTPPSPADVNKAALRALSKGKRTFTVDGSKYKINAKNKVELVTAAPTEQEVQEAAIKAAAKGKKTFTIKGFKYTFNAEGEIIPVIKKPKKPKIDPKQFATLQQAAQQALGGLTAFGFTVDIDPTIRITPAQVTADQPALTKAIQEALKSGKGQTVTIAGKKYTVSVKGKIVSIDPPKKPVEVPVKPKVTTKIITIPGTLGRQAKVTIDVNGKIIKIEPYTGPPVGVPVLPKLPDIPPKPPGSWGGGIPLNASLTLNQSSVTAVNQQAQQAVGDGVTIDSHYSTLPAFPALPHPKVTVGTGYAGLPNFPALPKKHVTVGTGYAPLPAFPGLPSPVVHVKVVYDVPQDAAGVVAGSMGGFAPNNPPRRMAGVRITHGPEFAIIGERGPEAVVPLSRSGPLDPDVRALLESVAFRRGMGGNGDTEPTVVQNIMLPSGDPLAAAMAVANRLALVRTV